MIALMGHILAIESSCDETAAAVVGYGGGLRVKSNIIASQIDAHKIYGGVVPEIASRKHIECITQVTEQALAQGGVGFGEIDAVAVTYAPGLVGALLVGVNYAKSLAFALKKPLIPVHHIEGHICANYIASPGLRPPFVCLVASGGHATIALAEDDTEYRVLAKTRDDAPGEAFDKIARALGLGYPGGPAVQEAAKNGRGDAFQFPRVQFDGSLDFSFSGVKTSVINTLHNYKQKGEEVPVHDIAASFQSAVVQVLAERLIACAKKARVKRVALAGGVASNTMLRTLAEQRAKEEGLEFYCPPPVLCTDNAVMIAARAFYDLRRGKYGKNDLNAVAALSLGEREAQASHRETTLCKP
ncbi:MAG: tRNA (adenosine(37)-N6)-threonylcarbamoyltransferase complex transferase subunit TsaD [Clostridiales bacterium]|jgi:N6-L-threonylcarbamoyladenine synthase|nr:tRNA (adenosine(37)-N6)-threonylcarbamoyltransferase complex transferase subunit TsaD [Clostridiales bacterium]